jgi:hypothetical protein
MQPPRNERKSQYETRLISVDYIGIPKGNLQKDEA